MVAAALFFDAEAAALLALLKRMIYTWINENSFVPQDEERHIYKLQKGEPTMTKLTLEEKQELIRELISSQLNTMFVTPKDIDETVKYLSFMISESLNKVFFEERPEEQPLQA